MEKNEPYACNASNAKKIFDWLQNRGGIFIWNSANLSNPGGSWKTPATHEDGTIGTRPTWEAGSYRHITDVADVKVYIDMEVKRFHVAVRPGGMGFKVTDGGSRKIRAEVAKAEEKYGKPAWHVFDYYSQDAVIMVQEEAIPLSEWINSQAFIGEAVTQ